MDVAVVTMNPTIDTYLSVRQITTGRKLRCTPHGREPGGGGINVARALRRLGIEPVVIYPCGGPNGMLLVGRLQAEHIEQRPVTCVNDMRENIVVLEDVTGENMRLVLPGPPLSEDEWRNCLREFDRLEPAPRFLIASGSLPPGVPPDFYARLVRSAKQKGTKVVLDSWGDPLRKAVEEGVFLLKASLPELERVAGEEITGKETQEHAARHVIEKGWAEAVLLPLGAGGVLMATADETVRLRAPGLPIRSRLGVGDSLVAGVVAALSEGSGLKEAVAFGVAAAGATLKAPSPELCSREQADAVLRTMKKP